MEYSKDIILNTKFTESEEKVEKGKGKFINGIKKHKVMTLIVVSSDALIAMDYMLVHSLIEILQRI